MKYLSRACVLLACVVLAACTPQPRLMPPPDDAVSRWENFQRMTPVSPVRLGGSLRFGPAQDTRRVTYLLWSNGAEPFRLDVQAGVGSIIAKVQVEDGSVLAYLPQDQKAYYGTDAPDKALRSLGITLPLSLADLNAFLVGRYAYAMEDAELLGFRTADNGVNVIYTLQDKYGRSELELSEKSLPVRWVSLLWQISVSYGDDNLPTRVDGLATPMEGPEQRFILLVKDREAPPLFAPGELTFALPEGTPLYSLD